MEAKLAGIFKAKKGGKTVDKGLSFPTCLSVNECVCHYSPLHSDTQVTLILMYSMVFLTLRLLPLPPLSFTLIFRSLFSFLLLVFSSLYIYCMFVPLSLCVYVLDMMTTVVATVVRSLGTAGLR